MIPTAIARLGGEYRDWSGGLYTERGLTASAVVTTRPG